MRPTWMRISHNTVVACSAGNFQAVAQRGQQLTQLVLQNRMMDARCGRLFGDRPLAPTLQERFCALLDEQSDAQELLGM